MQTWKKIIIDGEETTYSVSDDAHVRNDKTGRELKGTYTTNEYHSIQLTIKGKPKTFMVHRLVAMAFCENPDPKTYTIVDHIDRNYHNDHASNLRWATPSINAKNCERKKSLKGNFANETFFKFECIDLFEDNKYLININGDILKKDTGRILSQQDRHGYKRVLISGKYKSVHRLVWESFNKKEIPEGYFVDHIDGNKANNNLSNLRIVTHSENMFNAYANGHKNQIKVFQFDEKGKLIQEFPSFREAGRAMGVTSEAIEAASKRHQRSCGYYWLRESDKERIAEVLNDWIPEGYKLLNNYPDYCINEEGNVFSKKSGIFLTPIYWKDGVTKVVKLYGKRIKIQDLLNETFALKIL